MCPASAARVSKLFFNWGQGDQDAQEAMIPLVYAELRRIARRRQHERPGHTLQSATLVSDAVDVRSETLHEMGPPYAISILQSLRE